MFLFSHYFVKATGQASCLALLFLKLWKGFCKHGAATILPAGARITSGWWFFSSILKVTFNSHEEVVSKTWGEKTTVATLNALLSAGYVAVGGALSRCLFSWSVTDMWGSLSFNFVGFVLSFLDGRVATLCGGASQNENLQLRVDAGPYALLLCSVVCVIFLFMLRNSG